MGGPKPFLGESRSSKFGDVRCFVRAHLDVLDKDSGGGSYLASAQ